MYALALFFFFNDTATTEIYTLSLHDALPICREAGPDRAEDEVAGGHCRCAPEDERCPLGAGRPAGGHRDRGAAGRSEEHTSELQSQSNLVCRLLLEKKKKKIQSIT